MAALAAPVAAAPVAKEEPIWDLFFPRHKLEIMKEMDPFLTKDTAGIVISYVLGKENPFGAPEWKKYFGEEIVDPPKLCRGFYTWWFGRDPVEPGKLCCETHLPPVLRPSGMSLMKLGELVQAPKEGHPSKYTYRSAALEQNEKMQAGLGCFLVMRKDVFERNQAYEGQEKFIDALNAKTGVGYEKELSAIDLATVVFSRYICTGERHLGDDTGVEGRWTSSRTKEMIKYERGTCPLVVGGFAPDGLDVSSSYVSERRGIAGLRKF